MCKIYTKYNINISEYKHNHNLYTQNLYSVLLTVLCTTLMANVLHTDDSSLVHSIALLAQIRFTVHALLLSVVGYW